jgi:recombination protein RecT
MGTQELTRPAAGAVATQQNNSLGTLQGLLERYKHQIAVALPRHMTPERMIRVALSAVSSSPGLLECDPLSVAACVVQSSILGLEPSSVLGESYLVPFWNSRLRKKQAQLVPGYMGLVKLARQSGEVSIIDAQVVYSNDTFEFHKGSDVYWTHKWNRSGDRGEPQGVWAGYVLKDGSKNFEYWTLDQIETHRDKFSKGAFDRDGKLTGAWRDSPEWMWKKTVLRQVIKLMPKSIELSTALSLEERSDVGASQVFESLPVELQPEQEHPQLPAAPAAPKRKSEAAKPAADGFELEGDAQ